jgi:hypothetical protein
MRPREQTERLEPAVARQAAACAAAVVRTALLAARRAADGCGCRPCGQRAAATLAWATAMLAPDRAQVRPGARSPGVRRGPWDYW